MAAGFRHARSRPGPRQEHHRILTKNILLHAIARIMFLLVGYNIMYVDNSAGGWLPSFGSLMGSQADDAGHSLHPTSSSRWCSSPPPPPSSQVRWQSGMALVLPAVLRGDDRPSTTRGRLLELGGGFLKEAGFSDFAGSGIVRMAGAAAALAAVLLLGPVAANGNKGDLPHPGSSLPLATLGTLILWMGWFGFNGGSQLALSSAADATAIGTVFVSTNAAAAAGVVGAPLVSKLTWGRRISP